jgi:hypothetical protein
VLGWAGSGLRGRIPSIRRRAVLVEQAGEDWVRRAEVRDGGFAQGCPSTAPGTPVFVEYFGWILVSGRR